MDSLWTAFHEAKEELMANQPVTSSWQSIVDTIALVLVAISVGWMAISRPASESGSSRAPAPSRRPEPRLPAEPVSLTGAQLLGNRTAPIGVVMYSDFQCPFCGAFARDTLPELEEQYVRPGKVLLAFRQFPLPNHQFAVKAAEAAECAGRQGQFWPFHDRLFANPKQLDPTTLNDHARALALDPTKFETCLRGEAAATVQADKASGGPLDVVGTPSFLAGPMLRDGRVKVLQRLSGAQPVERFQAMLDRLISDSSAPTAQQ